jgi:tetratricopeptide (TPR) repeat protein
VPDNEKIKKMLAQILMKMEAFDDAILLYQSTLKDRPGDGESQFAIALILLQQEKDNEAEAYLQNLVNKPAWDAQACFYIGRIEYKKEHYDKALVWFDKVTQGGYVYDASMAAVSVLLKQKDYTEAENRINELLAKFPNQHLNILLLKAEIYNEQKDHQTAFDVLSDALKQFPEHRDLLYTRSLIAEKINRMDVLESDLKKILLKNPEDAGALNALGYTLVDRTERYDEAEQYLQQAIKLQPEEAVIIDSMGWLQFKQGKPVEALKYLRNAYDKQPESEIAAHLAEVLWTMGNKGEATDVFNEALKQSPEDEFLLKFQQRFLDLKGK